MCSGITNFVKFNEFWLVVNSVWVRYLSPPWWYIEYFCHPKKVPWCSFFISFPLPSPGFRSLISYGIVFPFLAFFRISHKTNSPALVGFCCWFLFCFVLFFVFWLCPQHEEVPKLGIKSEPDQWQLWILNSWATVGHYYNLLYLDLFCLA